MSSLYQHIKYDAGSYEGYEEERDDDQLGPEGTENGTNFTEIQVRCVSRCFLTSAVEMNAPHPCSSCFHPKAPLYDHLDISHPRDQQTVHSSTDLYSLLCSLIDIEEARHTWRSMSTKGTAKRFFDGMHVHQASDAHGACGDSVLGRFRTTFTA